MLQLELKRAPTPSRPTRRLAWYLAALAFALLSNFLFTGEWITRINDTLSYVWTDHQRWAVAGLLVAIALGAYAFNRDDDYLTEASGGNAAGVISRIRGGAWSFAPCIFAYLASAVLYWTQGETSAVRWLWVASIVGLIVPLLRRVDLRDFWPVPFWEYLLLIVILAGAFTMRYVRLTEVPYHVDNDVAIMGLFSRKLVLEGDWSWVGMAATNHQYSEHQFISMSMRLFGTDHYGLAMFGVLAGTATTGLIYFFGKIVFNRWVGFIAAAILASNYVHVHFSRIIFGPVSTFFVVLAGLFLMHGLRKRCLVGFALSGLSFGGGLLGYYSARVGPVIAASLFVLWFTQRKKWPGITLKFWAVGLAGILVAFGPNLTFALKEFNRFTGRGNDVVVWSDLIWRHLSDKYASQGSVAVVLKEQIKRTVLAPFYFPDESTICHLRRPMLGATAALSFILGLGFCLRRWRELFCVYPLLWVGLTFFFGGVLTTDPPFWPHLNIAIPAIVLVCAVGMERFCHRLIVVAGHRAAVAVPVGVVAMLFLSSIHNWDVYFRFARDHAGTRIHAMRQIEKLSSHYRVIFVSEGVRWDHETFQFFTPQMDGRNISGEDLLNNIPIIDKPTAFFVFAEMDRKYVDLLLKAFPGARSRGFWDGWKWAAFTMIQVFPPGYVEMPQQFLKPAPPLWSLPGWRLISVGLLGVLAAGGVLLRNELREKSGRKSFHTTHPLGARGNREGGDPTLEIASATTPPIKA